jgi:hypothetical protein
MDLVLCKKDRHAGQAYASHRCPCLQLATIRERKATRRQAKDYHAAYVLVELLHASLLVDIP